MTETGAQLFARLEARRCLKDLEPRLFPEDGGPDNGEVVEVYGSEGTGKTELLYHLLCRCLLPLSAGGLEVGVVFIDTDYSLDMSRLLLLTLHSLETSFSSRPALALLLIDSISAFYWLDRGEGGASYAKQEEKLSKCAELLGRLLRDYRITVFATCHSIRRNTTSTPPSTSSAAPPSSSSSRDQDRPYLCRSWQRLVTHRLICSRGETVPSTAASAAATGGTDQRRRQVFNVHCSSRSQGFRSSSFHVTDQGVEFITSSAED